MKRVYFMKPIGMAGPIKVGCSIAPESRLKSLDIWSPFPLEIIATAEGGNGHERAVHWHLRDDRLHGEWFSASARLLDLIAFVKASGALPPLETPPYGKTGRGRGANPGRDHELSLAKARLTRRIHRAERHAWGFWDRERRPQWVMDVHDSWQGAFTPMPDAETMLRIEEYISDLMSRPKETQSWRAWAEERRARELAA